MIYTPDTSRQHTTHLPPQLELAPAHSPLTRAEVHRCLELRVARDADASMARHIWMHRHYLTRWPVGPRTMLLTYVGDLRGVDPGPAGCAVAVAIALQSGSRARPFVAIRQALDLHPCCILELVRSWRADHLEPTVAPDLMPFTLRRLVKGGNGVQSLAQEWTARKVTGSLEALPRVLITYADPGVGHDGGLYLGAGALPIGTCSNGKLAFAWPLDLTLAPALKAWSAALTERIINA